jgi:hypothetical protein
MDIECRGLLRITWDLVLREHKLLGLMLPTTQDVAKCLIEGRKPTPEQAAAWEEANRIVTQEMLELNAGIAELQQSVDPLIRYDS